MTPDTASEYLRTLHDLGTRVQADAAGTELTLDAGMARGVAWLTSAREAGRKVLLVGNGGSAAIVAHMHVDLSNAARLRALLFTDTPMLTATANDLGYGAVFERPAELWAEPGDLLVAVSSSGRSENVLRAARACADRGGQVVTFTGFAPDNPLRLLGHLNFWVPAHAYGPVELIHGALGHFMTDALVRSAHVSVGVARAPGVRGELA